MAGMSHVDRCRKMALFLDRDKVTFEEYAYNITLTIVHGPIDEVDSCLATISPGLLAAYAAYLRDELEPHDFMPVTMAFVVDFDSESHIEAVHRNIRPRSLHLYWRVVGGMTGADAPDSSG